MTRDCQEISYRLRFQLSDLTIFSRNIRVCARQLRLTESIDAVGRHLRPDGPIPDDCRGYLLRGLPTREFPRVVFNEGPFLCYVLSQASRYYIDLRGTFDEYVQRHFSAKTRSTIRRKVRKFAEYCDGELIWKAYRSPAEMAEFLAGARRVATETYQEKLFQGGIPSDDEFQARMQDEADHGNVRAYLLFHGDRPVSYLCLTADKGTLTYDYLGYLPEYAGWSVGTVLQWLALESLFDEGRFQLFDFTEGEGDHKRLFATDHLVVANVFFLRRTAGNYLLVWSHRASNAFSSLIGDVLDRWNLKKRIKRFIRFGAVNP